jgi:pyruvate ferredoxin oxidoreductase gamma subunit
MPYRLPRTAKSVRKTVNKTAFRRRIQMKEIRIHGRGGQGSVTAAEMISIAAFEDGKFSQAFPAFGVERRGAPVQAFTRISDRPIRLRSQIYAPDYVIVQDATLLETVNVASGIKDDGIIIVNTTEKPESLKLDTKARVMTVDATKVAMDIIGFPIVNTVLLGAFAGATGEIDVESIKKAVKGRFSGKVAEKNAQAIQKAYDLIKGEEA